MRSGAPEVSWPETVMAVGAHYLDLDARNGEAALRSRLGVIADLLEHGVDDNEILVLDSGDQDALEASDLVGGEADALVLSHGRQHLLRQMRQRFVERVDRRGARLQHRVSKRPDFECHVF